MAAAAAPRNIVANPRSYCPSFSLPNRGVLPSEVNLLVKPFSSQALVEAVIRLLGEKK